MSGNSELPNIVETGGAASPFFGSRQHRQQHGSKDGYDGDNDQQFNQGKGFSRVHIEGESPISIVSSGATEYLVVAHLFNRFPADRTIKQTDIAALGTKDHRWLAKNIAE